MIRSRNNPARPVFVSLPRNPRDAQREEWSDTNGPLDRLKSGQKEKDKTVFSLGWVQRREVLTLGRCQRCMLKEWWRVENTVFALRSKKGKEMNTADKINMAGVMVNVIVAIATTAAVIV